MNLLWICPNPSCGRLLKLYYYSRSYSMACPNCLFNIIVAMPPNVAVSTEYAMDYLEYLLKQASKPSELTNEEHLT